MKVLLSIKPEYADKIFNGSKRFEFRKAVFKRRDIKTVVVYASSPVCRVIGEFEIGGIITENPKVLWKSTSKASGITEDFFFQYFAEREIGHAIRVEKVTKYETPLRLTEAFNISFPPQSFQYLN